MKLRAYSMAKLEEQPDTGPVWVQNATRGDRRGDVVLTVARNSGIGSDTLVVPSTFIPLDLTTIVSRPQLLRDNQFRQALASGLLVLVHPEDATNLFIDDEDARAEQQRLSNYMLVGGVVHQQQAVQSDIEIHGESKPNADAGIPGPVVDLIQRMVVASGKNEDDEGYLTEQMENDASSKLRNMGELSDDVLQHVHARLRKIAPKVAATAKKMRS